MSQTYHKLIKLHGLVTPADWDEKGNVIGIALSTFNEDEYLIEKDEISNQLKSFIHQQVEIMGKCSENHGRKTVTVKEYRLKDNSSSIC